MAQRPAKSDAFLIALDLTGRKCLVVGNGEEAARRATSLVAAGADVHVVADAPTDEVRALGASGMALSVRPFEERDLANAWLGVLADTDAALAARMASVAETHRVFFCAVDQPAFGTYSHVALVRSGPVTLGISTNGRAPALARKLREELERLFAAAGLAEFAERLAKLRDSTPSADRKSVLGGAVSGLRIDGPLTLPKH